LNQYPGEGRVFFDPNSAANLAQVLGSLKELPRKVVVSPMSDPLPPSREIREEAVRVIATLLQRGISVLVMTRGAVPRRLIEILAKYRERARVELGLTTLDKKLSRILEPAAASPRGRLRTLSRLVAAEVPTAVRFEPLMSGLTDARDNVARLFDALAERGVERVIAHYLFLHPAMIEPLKRALEPIGWGERIVGQYDSGPMYRIGSVGATRHLPVDARKEGLARVTAWGAERGLVVETGVTQNPDFPRPLSESAPIKVQRPATPSR
jgi:DNA repair photolyase